MGSLADIRAGIKNNLSSLNIKVHDVWPDSVNVPCAIVQPQSGASRRAMSGGYAITFEVLFLAAAFEKMAFDNGQRKLDEYLEDTGSKSIRAALLSDDTLNNTVDTMSDPSWAEYGLIEVADIRYWGVKFSFEVEPAL